MLYNQIEKQVIQQLYYKMELLLTLMIVMENYKQQVTQILGRHSVATLRQRLKTLIKTYTSIILIQVKDLV